MMFVVAYDVSDDGKRARCSALLQAFGNRVQRSVFICWLEDEQLTDLRAHLEAIVDVRHDMVSFFRQCQGCAGEVITIGQVDLRPPEVCWVVM